MAYIRQMEPDDRLVLTEPRDEDVPHMRAATMSITYLGKNGRTPRLLFEMRRGTDSVFSQELEADAEKGVHLQYPIPARITALVRTGRMASISIESSNEVHIEHIPFKAGFVRPKQARP